MKYLKKKVKNNIEVSKGIFKLTVEGDFNIKPGQFYMLKAWSEGIILPRPISIYDCNFSEISFLYAVRGKGTKILSELKNNDEIEIMGPLGNGFEIENINGNIAIISGGIGIAPMNYLIKSLKNCNIDLYAGFKDKDFAIDELKEYVNAINIATETGVKGYKGYITALLEPNKYDFVICCGSEIMMKKVVQDCKDKKVTVYTSMENRMACGVGACLVCTCKTKFGNKRTCKDGPVFNGKDLVFND